MQRTKQVSLGVLMANLHRSGLLKAWTIFGCQNTSMVSPS